MSGQAPIRSGRKNGPSGKSWSDLASGKIFQLASRHSKLFALTAIACVLTVVAGHVLLPSYRSKSTLNLRAAINNPLQSLSARLGGFSGFDVDGREADRFLARLRVYSFFSQIAEAVKKDPYLRGVKENEFVAGKTLRMLYGEHFKKRLSRELAEISEHELANRLMHMVTLTKDGIEAVSIHTVTASPEVSYRLTNIVAHVSIDALVEFEVQELKDSDYYLKIQAKKTQDSIQETENAIADFKRSKRIFTVNTSFEDASTRATELRRELVELNARIDENQAAMNRIAKAEASDGTRGSEPSYKYSLGRKLTGLQKENAALSAREKSLKKALEGLYRTYDANTEQQLSELKKKLELETSLLQELKKHDFQMEMRRISAKSKFHILEAARLDSVQPSESLFSKLIVGFLICFGVSSLIAYAIEQAFPLAGARLDLEEAGLEVIGTIPHGRKAIKARKPLLGWKKEKKLSLPASSTPIMREMNSSITRICSLIVNKRELAKDHEDGWVITVTSSEPGEGKSFTAERLAAGLAGFNHRVLLIDGDFRSPSVSEQYNAMLSHGLAEVVEDKRNFGKYRMGQIQKGLDLLPAGLVRADPAKIFASPKFVGLIGDLKSLYDYIVIDTPPVSVAGDSAIITKISDLPIVVVGMSEVYLQMLHSSVAGITAFHNGPLYGILNKVPYSKHFGYGYGNGYGYGHYDRRGRYAQAAFDNEDSPPPGMRAV